jgi:hypothetical protein
MRYAHTSRQAKKDAVAKLGDKTVTLLKKKAS